MSFIIKKVGCESYLQRIGKSAVSEQDLWFVPVRDDAHKSMFFHDAYEALKLCNDKWDLQCIMVEV